ncbi:MAG: adenosylmethionine--8-amino-7-oxononanoate transaminase [Microthrixaceae bacterium]
MTDEQRQDQPGNDVVERDREVLWHPYAAMPAAMPQVPVIGASGTRLRLADGREVIDGMSSWWAAIHGYRHPVLDDALRAQIDVMSHVMFGGLTHEPAVRLAELLVELAPGGLEHVFLADSGSVSVEVAIKMALQHARGTGHPERSRLLTVRSGYHGDTLAAMSVCDPLTGMHSMFADVLPQQIFAPAPEPAFGAEFERSHIAGFERLLVAHRDEVAAVILEPVVQGAGGMRFYSPDYLAAVRSLCTEHGVLLIADEIATGFGRSGEMFGCDHAGVSPDIMCVGKALTGGYMSMAAVLCTAKVADGVSAAESGALMHGPTFMGNPLGAAVSIASIELLLSRPWRQEVAAIEARLRDGLAPVGELPGVADVRVLGAIGVIEADEPVPMAQTQEVVLDHGVWLRPFGRLIYTMPPYVSSASDLDAITGAMAAAARSLSP